MSLKQQKYFLFVFLLLVLSACSTMISLPELPEGKSEDPFAAWTKVLKNYVNLQGQVDFKGLAESQEDLQALESYLRYISVVDPKSKAEEFPSKNDKLAYYINSYNALAMYGVIKKGIPKDLKSSIKRADFFYLTNYMLGGEEMNLFTYENKVIRPLGDPRIHFALNCMSVGCPRLPQEPFLSSQLDEQLDAVTKEFFNSDKYVQIDHSNSKVKLSEILSFYKEDFVSPGVASSLVEYANKYREEAVPLNYSVEFIQYDWTINAQ